MAQHGLKEILDDLTRAFVVAFIRSGYIIIHLRIAEFLLVDPRATCFAMKDKTCTFVM